MNTGQASQHTELPPKTIRYCEEIDRKTSKLNGLGRALYKLACNRHRDDCPDCPIIDDLAGELHA